MIKRIVIAGIVGGILMFFWGGLSHQVLSLGHAGIESLPADEVLMAALKTNVPASGFYFFPAWDQRPGMSKDETAAATKVLYDKVRRGPSGILVYTASGEEPESPRQLMTELESNIGCALFAALLVAHMAGASYLRRLLAVASLGLIAWLSIEVSYWNWYHFPALYTLGQLADQVIGFLVAGLAIAAIVKPRAT